MANDVDYDAERPIYLPDGRRFAVARSADALAAACAANQPVLIYVHGRAKDIGEPRKSIELGIYRGLATYMGACIVAELAKDGRLGDGRGRLFTNGTQRG